jgi:hypothetical protein
MSWDNQCNCVAARTERAHLLLFLAIERLKNPRLLERAARRQHGGVDTLPAGEGPPVRLARHQHRVEQRTEHDLATFAGLERGHTHVTRQFLVVTSRTNS